jgi:hypothetical protein
MKDPDNSEIRALISEIEMCLEALKRKLNLVPDPASVSRIVASSAFGRRSCANRPLRTSTAPAAPLVDKNLGSL